MNKIKNIFWLGFILIWLGCLSPQFSLAAPIISNEELVSISDDHMVITWQTTNENSTASIKWGYNNPPSITYTTDEAGTTKHYLTLSNLYPNTTYYYKIFSRSSTGTTEGDIHSFTTLARPGGNYLFSFAALTDLHYSPNQANTTNVRGRPYASSEAIITALVSAINQHSPAFTVIKGDMLDAAIDSPPLTRTNQLKALLDNLNNDPTKFKYYAIPGNHDKTINYGSGKNWVTDNLGILCTQESGLPAGDSTFNYSFVHNNYRFVMLDSLRNDGVTAEVNTTTLEAELAAAQSAKQKTFVFMHNEASEEGDIPDDILRAVLDQDSGTVDQNRIRLSNKTAFFNTLYAHQLENGEPVVASVFMGHVHDNRRRDFNNIPFVRTSSGLQYPTGYVIYKVYSNGYTQTFYKLPGFSEELSRDLITGTGEVTASRAQQFYLGGLSSRNFTVTYSASGTNTSPTVEATQPSANSSDIALNQPIIISFTKAMSRETAVADWITLTASGTAIALTSADWSWNTDKTILTITKTWAANKNHVVTIEGGASGASATDNTTFSSDYTFAFATGSRTSTTGPIAAFNRLVNDGGTISDVTSNVQPTLTGIATDDSGSTIASIECRYTISSSTFSNWLAATPLSGAFRSSQEAFSFTLPDELLRGSHTIEARVTNAAGLTSSGTLGAYTFWVISGKPEITIKANGTSIINGDPIGTTPSLEITAVTDVTLDQLWLTIDTTRIDLKALISSPTFVNTVSYHPTLVAGSHNFLIEATDIDTSGLRRTSTKEVVSLLVETSGDSRIFSAPINYPNPFDPSTQTTTISYILSKDTNVTLKLFDLSGTLLMTQSYLSGQNGGKAGYNEVTWDGRSGGGLVGNGLYIYLLIAEGRVMPNGIGKLTVFKR